MTTYFKNVVSLVVILMILISITGCSKTAQIYNEDNSTSILSEFEDDSISFIESSTQEDSTEPSESSSNNNDNTTETLYSIPNPETTESQSSNRENDILTDSAVIIVENANGKKGDEITVALKIKNNPGIAGARFRIAYDKELLLKDADTGSAFDVLDFTPPGRYDNPCFFTWDSESGMATGDGVILNLSFEISDTARVGQSLLISCSYRPGDVFDEALEDVELETVDGYINVIN